MKDLGFARLAAALALVSLGASTASATDAVVKADSADSLRQTFASNASRLIAKRAANPRPLAKIGKGRRKAAA